MKEFLKFVKDKIERNLSTEEIIILDNSQKHKNHKFYNEKKYHIALEIKSNYLSSLSRLSAQRMVMKILQPELKSKIHALEIKIK
tara:strand:- start:69 stop:323 length:255 start_codon:yes stop_codon:yes gene_type:complete